MTTPLTPADLAALRALVGTPLVGAVEIFQAWTAIPRLLDALEASEAEVVGWKANHAAAEDGWMKAAAERDAARAEVARLAEGYRVSELNRARAEAEVERLRGALREADDALAKFPRQPHMTALMVQAEHTRFRINEALRPARTVLGEEGTR